MPIEKMTITAIKAQVIRVEGFDLEIEGGLRKIDARLHTKRQSSGDKSVSQWISDNFPDVENVRIFILNAKGRPAKRNDLLKTVREGYSPNIKKIAKAKEKAEKKATDAAALVTDKEIVINRLKGDNKKSKGEVEAARQAGERGAALDALDIALQKINVHPRVKELCETAISNGLQETQALIERMLAAWSLAEKEKDILGRSTDNR